MLLLVERILHFDTPCLQMLVQTKLTCTVNNQLFTLSKLYCFPLIISISDPNTIIATIELFVLLRPNTR